MDSLDLGVRKPDARAYAAAADAIGRPAGECLFIDDLTVNVLASWAAGMPAERFDVKDVPGSLHRIATAADL